MRGTSYTKGTLGKSPLSVRINEFLFTSVGSGGGVSPNKPKAFVYQMVIFTTAAVGNAIGGGSGRVI